METSLVFQGTRKMLTSLLFPFLGTQRFHLEKGSHLAPQAILNASTQLEFFHHDVENAFEINVFMTEVSSEWKKINNRCSEKSSEYIRYFEEEGQEKQKAISKKKLKISIIPKVSWHKTLRKDVIL